MQNNSIICILVDSSIKQTNTMNIQITSEQKVRITLAPKSDAGNDAVVDGAPQWSVSSGDATVEPEEGGLSAWIISGAPGDSVIAVNADADLGEGVRTISDRIDLKVTGPEASSLGLTVEPAVPK